MLKGLYFDVGPPLDEENDIYIPEWGITWAIQEAVGLFKCSELSHSTSLYANEDIRCFNVWSC